MDPKLILIDGSSLVTRVIGPEVLAEGTIIPEGAFTGGDIELISDVYIRSVDSIIDSSGLSSVPGSASGSVQESGVIIQDGNLVVLPESLLDADSQLPERCATKLDGNYSSLIVVGCGGVPMAPRDYIPAYQLSGGDWSEELGIKNVQP